MIVAFSEITSCSIFI